MFGKVGSAKISKALSFISGTVAVVGLDSGVVDDIKSRQANSTYAKYEIVTNICSCHNFFYLSSVQIILYQLVAYCVCFKMIYKKSI